MGGGVDGGGYRDWRSESTPAPKPEPREELYYAEQYKIFMIACTPNEFGHLNRISVRPYHTLPAQTAESMRAVAKPWTEETADDCKITIRLDQETFALQLIDGNTQVTSRFPLSELDAESRAALLYKSQVRSTFNHLVSVKTLDPWEKYTAENTAEPVKKPGALSL